MIVLYPKNKVGPQGPQGEIGPMGPKGPAGKPPEHQWKGTKLRFKNPDGSWGEWIELKGKQGEAGDKGRAGSTQIVQDQGASIEEYGKKLMYHLAEMAAYDKIVAITYHDSGLRTERINTVEMSSVAFPDANILKTVSYLDVGMMNQRVEKIEYTGTIFNPDSLRKVFEYSLVGNKYRTDGHFYEYY